MSNTTTSHTSYTDTGITVEGALKVISAARDYLDAIGFDGDDVDGFCSPDEWARIIRSACTGVIDGERIDFAVEEAVEAFMDGELA